ncbi:MAG: L-threonylcarbamoyladenylate synthase [Actinomycetota bacterium]|nr:L-threonylcarbamoyladenylate synthase [Actinomycetota bacterium]
MRIVPVADPPEPGVVEVAARALTSGQIVGLPTDTVYGLGADAFDAVAAGRLLAAKRRPALVGVAVLVADEDQAESLAESVPPVARVLMSRFWPGALTIVVRGRATLPPHVGAGDATIGVRCPAHPVPLALSRAVGPLATTSANLHGQPTLTTAAAVAATFGESVPLVLDGGTCVGSPSTVVRCTGEQPELVREGRIPWIEVRRALRGGREG